MKDQCVRWISLRGKAEIVDGRHAETAENVYLDRGIVRKRHGYRQIVKFDDAINGVFFVDIGRKQYELVYAGTRFYLRDLEQDDVRENYIDITLSSTKPGSIVDPSRLVDRPIGVYVQNFKAYIVGCGDYLVLKSVGDHPELRRVEEEEDTYIPTTTRGIGCMCEAKYIPTTVDEQTVGIFYVKNVDGAYEEVVLDGDENLPDGRLTYYRKVDSLQLGHRYEHVNMMTSYRKNTLYGTAASQASYRLDADCIDPDGDFQVDVDVMQSGEPKHYTLHAREHGNVLRAPVEGDDLSGVTVVLMSTTQTGVGALHLLPLSNGIYEMHASGGYMRWEASGGMPSDWDTAMLMLHCGTEMRCVAIATRPNFLSPYTVTWECSQIVFPENFGVVSSIGSLLPQTEWYGSLPLLQTELTDAGIAWGNIDFRKSTITFSKPTTPIDEQDNITVLYKHYDNTFNAQCIAATKVSALYGVAGNADRLFVGASDAAPTVDYHSESDDWTYFAPEGYRELGKTGYIAAYVKSSGGLLTLLKGGASPNAYWRTGVWGTESIRIGEDAYDVEYAVFGITHTASLPEVASPNVAGALDSDTLYMAKNGLYRVLENALTDDKKAMRLSAPIDGVQCGEQSVAIVHDLRYFVSTGKEVYVGDSRYRLAMDSDSSYEWTIWTIPDVRVWYRERDALCFGTNDGRLCRFEDAFEDVTYEDTQAGQLTVSLSENQLAYDDELSIGEGDELYFDQSVYAVKAVPVDLSEERVYVDSHSILHVYEGDAVRLASEATVGPMYYVKDVDWGKCSFSLCDEAGADVSIPVDVTHVLTDLAGRKTYCRHCADGTTSLSERDGEEIVLYAAELPHALTARVVHRKPVCAVYASVVNALNTPDLTKILLSATVEAESEKAGEALFSCRTSSYEQKAQVAGINALRYDWLDMGRFTFDGAFPRAHTIRMKMRFHFIQWKIESNNAGDMAIRGLCLRYRYLQPAKGVSE